MFPLWVVLGVAVAVAATVKAQRGWLLLVAVLFGLLIASTNVGQQIKNTVDHMTSPTSTVSAPTGGKR
jgi:hypothetical protein